MAELLERLRDIVDGQVDFHGQKKAEYISESILSVSALLAFIIGYIMQDIKVAMYISLGGPAINFLLVVPPWPFFNRHPVKWYQA